MDFFRSQDHAKKQTGRLVFYFLASVVIIIVAVYCIAAIAKAAVTKENDPFRDFDVSLFFMTTAGTVLVILLGSLFKTAQLSAGGKAVAESLGGRQINPSTQDPIERRLLNIVEEMSIASGVPSPPVYVMDREPGINAFAAGFRPGDAVVGVTRGCMEELTRDELQGVIAHEFSHILNGDMRLSIRLMGLLHGILLLALTGTFILRMFFHADNRRWQSRDRSDDGKGGGGGIVLVIMVIGVGLYIIGWIGVFFGRLIKAGVSRQREFLADASAVQFTRYPEGLANALKRIGGYAGSKMNAPNAEEASHLYFSDGIGWMIGLFATHPPIVERISRLDPQFDGKMIARPDTPAAYAEMEQEGLAGLTQAPRRRGPVAPREAMEAVGDPQPEHITYARNALKELPPMLVEAAHNPFSARALVMSLIVAENYSDRTGAIKEWRSKADPKLVAETDRLLPMALVTLPEQRLPIVELTFPAMQLMTQRQREDFHRDANLLVKADQKISLFEFTVQRTLMRRLLDQPYRKVSRPDPQKVAEATIVLLGALAHAGERNQAAFAFKVGMDRIHLSVELPPPEACGIPEVDRALGILVSTSMDFKKVLLDACSACVGADGKITVKESELFRAIGDSLDCPVAPMLANA